MSGAAKVRSTESSRSRVRAAVDENAAKQDKVAKTKPKPPSSEGKSDAPIILKTGATKNLARSTPVAPVVATKGERRVAPRRAARIDRGAAFLPRKFTGRQWLPQKWP